MFEKKTKCPHRHAILEEIGKKDPTGEEVLDHLFGAYDSDYTLRKWVEPRTTLSNRLCIPIVWPFAVVVCSVKWLVTGTFGFNSGTLPHKVLKRLLGG